MLTLRDRGSLHNGGDSSVCQGGSDKEWAQRSLASRCTGLQPRPTSSPGNDSDARFFLLAEPHNNTPPALCIRPSGIVNPSAAQSASTEPSAGTETHWPLAGACLAQTRPPLRRTHCARDPTARWRPSWRIACGGPHSWWQTSALCRPRLCC